MMLSEHDKALLELTALKVPWEMVCADFHERYGTPGVLAHRLFELQEQGLVTILSTGADDELPTPEALEADAIANQCYQDLNLLQPPRWEFLITETGFVRIEDDLKEQ